MSPHPATRAAATSVLATALLIGTAGCDPLPTDPSPARPTAPAYRLSDPPLVTVPGPLDVTPQPPPPSIQ